DEPQNDEDDVPQATQMAACVRTCFGNVSTFVGRGIHERWDRSRGGPKWPLALVGSPQDYRLKARRHARRTWRGSQVVRQRSAKPLFAGSIPARASLRPKAYGAPSEGAPSSSVPFLIN